MGITEEGIAGEQWWLNRMRNNPNVEICFQPDTLIKQINGKWYVHEFKHQEMFKSPPYDGHGLPPYQVEARLLFQKDTGIRAVFVVREKNKNILYIQYLDILEKGEHFDTNGPKVRRIYNIKSFKKIEF